MYIVTSADTKAQLNSLFTLLAKMKLEPKWIQHKQTKEEWGYWEIAVPAEFREIARHIYFKVWLPNHTKQHQQ